MVHILNLYNVTSRFYLNEAGGWGGYHGIHAWNNVVSISTKGITIA